jgi:hypothetical protein
VKDPIADGLDVLQALRELFHFTFHWRRCWLPNETQDQRPRELEMTFACCDRQA